jgi:hypothetical protein
MVCKFGEGMRICNLIDTILKQTEPSNVQINQRSALASSPTIAALFKHNGIPPPG